MFDVDIWKIFKQVEKYARINTALVIGIVSAFSTCAVFLNQSDFLHVL